MLIFGANGQVGEALKRECERRDLMCVLVSREEADFSRPASLVSILEKYKPDFVVNAAAYTAVDKAEEEEDLATAVNAISPGVIAKWCAAHDTPFITYSTDYVFDGEKEAPYVETDEPSPVSAYGRSKFVGENLVAQAGGRWVVLRTSWVYSEIGRNFVLTMLKLGAEKKELKIVNDQWGAPTYAGDLAALTLDLAELMEPEDFRDSGIYHACNGGRTNWFSFAERIFEIARRQGRPLALQKLIPIPASEYKAAARRPRNSSLSTAKLKDTFGLELRDYASALESCLENLK